MDGDKVICEIKYSSLNKLSNEELNGIITKILGKAGEFNTEKAAILEKYYLEKNFSKPVLNEAEKINGQVDTAGRLDYRNKICFTIDPGDAKDFDDAVSVEKKENSGYIIGVHIADVSHFVIQNSKTDKEAMQRGTSVYLVNKVIPMLPEKLSNEICSLKENKERLTFSVLIHLNKLLNVTGYEIKESVIKSSKRFNYEEVQKIIDSKKGGFYSELSLMYQISRKLLNKRLKEGSLDFETSEISFEINDKNEVININPKPRLDSMRMIEEFMLLANKCVTEYVNNLSKKIKNKLPFIYRIHDKPDADKLKDLNEFILQFGYDINLTNKNSLKKLLDSVKGKEEDFIINDLLIRAMAKAKYSDENIGHYGLGFENYTHFTSPIRRYPDLVVHRLLKYYLNLDKNITGRADSGKFNLPEICRISTEKEQNAVNAEREYIKIMQLEFLKKKTGQVFKGIVTSVFEFGFFVELTDFLIDGLIRYRDLNNDYYVYNPARKYATGRRRNNKIKAGQKIYVRILAVNLETRKLELEMCDKEN